MSSKRADILIATRDLIIEQGLQSTSMSQIAKHAGVGMGTIYNYFGSKEELVNVLYGELKAALTEFVLHNYDADQPIITRFEQIGLNMIRYGLGHPQEAQLLEQLAYSPYIQLEVKSSDFEFHKVLETLIADAQAQHMIKDLPPEMIVEISNGMIGALLRAHMAGTLTLTDDLIAQAVQVGWDAIKR